MHTETKLASPATGSVGRQTLNGATMGTRYSAVFFTAESGSLDRIGTTLQARVDRVDRQMSTWIADSDLMRLNRVVVGEWVEVPDALLTVISAGLDMGRRTGGAFDIGVGDLVAAWGFGVNSVPNADLAERLARTARRPTHEILEVDVAAGRVRKHAAVALDLSGIAKGFGVDQLAETLEGFGIRDYLVSIDGEVRARGAKPGNAPWRVAVEKPDRSARDVAGVVELKESALATSGNYRHWVDVNGQSFSHTMDPRTGRPLQNGLAAVTVRAESCMLADAWATAMLVLGERAGRPLAVAAGVEALFVAEGA